MMINFIFFILLQDAAEFLVLLYISICTLRKNTFFKFYIAYNEAGSPAGRSAMFDGGCDMGDEFQFHCICILYLNKAM